jgi:hypothetical protein
MHAAGPLSNDMHNAAVKAPVAGSTIESFADPVSGAHAAIADNQQFRGCRKPCLGEFLAQDLQIGRQIPFIRNGIRVQSVGNNYLDRDCFLPPLPELLERLNRG